MPETGFTIPTRDEVIDQAVADVTSRVGTVGLITRGLAYVTAIVVGGLLHGCYGAVERLLRLVLWDTAGGSFLDRWAGLLGVYRIAAIKAQGSFTLTGTDGYTVDAGAEAYRADGVRYETLADVTISGGTATVTMRALVGGTDGNCVSGTELTFAAVWTGVDSTATAAADLDNGAEEEGDADLLERLRQRAEETPQGGAETDYEQWVKAYSTTIDEAWCFGNTPADGDVLVIFTNKVAAGGVPGDVIPSAGDVSNVQTYLDARRPVNDKLTVSAPTPLLIEIDASITPDTAATRAAAEASVDALFQDEAEPGSTLANSRLRGAFDRATGEESHVINSLQIGGVPATTLDDIVLGTLEVPVRDITWT